MNQHLKHTLIATAMALALGATAAHAADTTTNTNMTGKQKATAIGAGSGAVAGAVVGGPIGAVVGAGVGAVVGHEGTDANGHVSTTDSATHHHMARSDEQVTKAQAALNDKGYNLSVDGQYGPNTATAVRDFQAKNGLAASGTLDDATLTALGVRG